MDRLMELRLTAGMSTNTQTNDTILVIGATGKTGRRVAERLTARGWPVRAGSRSGAPAFDWDDPATWPAALRDVGAVYVSFQPDLVVPGATATIGAFVAQAVASGVRRMVLLSGRREALAQQAERLVLDSGLEATIVRCAWFNQNFSEGFLLDAVLSGRVELPVGDVTEPFVDSDDIADVAVAALTEDGHEGQVYELTGPRLMTFADVVAELSAASGREIDFETVEREAFADGLSAAGLPADAVWLVDHLFAEVLDGRNASLADGVERALGRAPRDFADYARETAASGVWAAPEQVAERRAVS